MVNNIYAGLACGGLATHHIVASGHSRMVLAGIHKQQCLDSFARQRGRYVNISCGGSATHPTKIR